MENYERLSREVLSLSSSDVLEEAFSEWDLIEVYDTNAKQDFTQEFEQDYEAEFETCLCGHYPISEVYVLRNRETGHEIKIGNVCITHFEDGKEWEHIVKDYKKVKKDISKRLSQTSLDFMRDKKVQGFQSYKFYSKRVNRKITTLSDAELSTIKKVNQLFISFIERTSKVVPVVEPVHEWKYNGISFDSRLVAQWAVYFDGVGIEYEYKKKHVGIHNGVKALPDFWLPQVEMYAYVSPNEFSRSEMGLIKEVAISSQCPVLLLAGAPSYGSYYASEPGIYIDDDSNLVVLPDTTMIDYVLNGYHGYLWNEGRFFSMAEFSHSPCDENKDDFLNWFDDGRTEEAINMAMSYKFG